MRKFNSANRKEGSLLHRHSWRSAHPLQQMYTMLKNYKTRVSDLHEVISKQRSNASGRTSRHALRHACLHSMLHTYTSHGNKSHQIRTLYEFPFLNYKPFEIWALCDLMAFVPYGFTRATKKVPPVLTFFSTYKLVWDRHTDWQTENNMYWGLQSEGPGNKP